MSGKIVTHFKGPGQWYAQARRLQHEHARVHPDETPPPKVEKPDAEVEHDDDR